MKIGVYVAEKQAKQNYKNESYNIRGWPGLELILDCLRRNDIEYNYVGKSTVHEYDLILVSITSDCDWWPFIAERIRWQKGNYRILAGGAGILNVRPFLDIVDIFLLGRGKNIIIDLVKAEQARSKLNNNSVIYSNNFNVDKKYKIAQVDRPYLYPVKLANDKTFVESSIGCPNKCFFCGYTWQRKYIGDGNFSAGVDSVTGGNKERTIIDLLNMPVKDWQKDAQIRIVGLDGLSERLRFKANKRITREMFREFLRGLLKLEKPHQIKVYCIVGFPTETVDDWYEFLEDIEIVDKDLMAGKQWSLLFHFTPFRAMPATPSATWLMSYKNYRGVISRTLKKNHKGNIFFQGKKFWAVEGMGTDSLSSVILSAIILRGIESDRDIIEKIATSKKFWRSSSSVKIATLEKYINCDRFFKKYTQGNLPTRYIDWKSKVA